MIKPKNNCLLIWFHFYLSAIFADIILPNIKEYYLFILISNNIISINYLNGWETVKNKIIIRNSYIIENLSSIFNTLTYFIIMKIIKYQIIWLLYNRLVSID